jgi:hypothetical protein
MWCLPEGDGDIPGVGAKSKKPFPAKLISQTMLAESEWVDTTPNRINVMVHE